MCGICGIISQIQQVRLEELRELNSYLKHRGPDAEGYFLNEDHSVGLAHQRLSIIDLSDSGKQPMSYLKERFWLTYNGEVFNFIELRHELQENGYSFVTHTDSEVILAAYAEWGVEMFNK